MRIIKTMLSCMCLMLLIVVVAEAKKWHGIVPLHSTRADVERLLGPSTDSCRCHYYSDNESVFIIYASGSFCDEDESSSWKVPRDTVISIAVYSKTELQFSDLKIDENKFEKKANEEMPGLFYYFNYEEGLEVERTGNTVGGITYFPAAKDNYLRCPNSSVKQPRKK